jgi:DNA-binding PadR family transcriptional regulator
MRGYGGHHGYRGGGGGPGDGRRMRRGMVPALVLAALLDGPAHGYELMDRLERSSGGDWRPSPGSIYPLLQAFEDRGLVESRQAEGRRVFALTDAGREQANQRRAGAVAETMPVDSRHSRLRAEMQHLQAASQRLAAVATPEQLTDAVAIVRGARQALYRLLAEQ